jgi:hypothetical protein
MPLCHDPLVTLLTSFKFNAVRVPRNDYVPGAVLVRSRDGSISLLGAFHEVFELASGESLPITEAGTAEAFEGATSATYRGKVAAKLLSEWLGSASPGVASGFSGAKRIRYEIQQTRLLSASLSTVLRLLKEADPSDSLLGLAHARLYVIAEVLQAKAVVLIADSGAAGGVTVETSMVPRTSARGSPTIEIDARRGTGGMLRLTFADYQTIGFKAHEVEITDGTYVLVAATAKGLSHMAAPPEAYDPVLFEPDALL